MTTESYWQATATSLPPFPSLTQDLTVDVVIIGGGLTGITAAYYLKKEGVKVALLERNRFGCCDTGHTTAHLTYVTDERLHEVVQKFGKEAAQSFWEAGAAAIDMIYQNVRDLAMDCEFKWVPGFLHASLASDDKTARESLQKDLEAAVQMGFDATFVEEVPYAKQPGVRFAHQAKFHPLKYLAPLLERIAGGGSYVFENTEASEIEGNPLTVHAGQFKIRCDYLVIATHTPLTGKSSLASATLFQTTADVFLRTPELSDEIFGPTTLLVTSGTREQLIEIASSMEGQLTAAIFGTAVDLRDFADLVSILETKVGRLVFNAFPTGVEVGHAMVHGGMYPATSDSRSTSVGTRAIHRFSRLVCYQGFPQDSLPDELKDDNPKGIWRMVDGEFTKNTC